MPIYPEETTQDSMLDHNLAAEETEPQDMKA